MADKSGVMVGTLADVEIIALCEQGSLISSGFNKNNVKQACYELTVGSVSYELPSGKLIKEPPDGTILIRPKQLTTVITAEELSLTADLLGRILTKGKLFSIGLLPVNTYADPGFRGRLGVTLYNASNEYVKLPVGEPFAKIEFSRLERSVAEPYRGQHGYETEIWPIPRQLIMSPEECSQDKRIASQWVEFERSHGKFLASLVRRIVEYESKLLATVLIYLAASLVFLSGIPVCQDDLRQIDPSELD